MEDLNQVAGWVATNTEMVWILMFFTLLGFNFTFWILVSLVRSLVENVFFKKKEKTIFYSHAYIPRDVAVIVPAHNEEKTIMRTLSPLFRILPKDNIYVVSDYSTDKTNVLLRPLGIHLLELTPNRGKARAIVAIMEKYHLLDRYQFILINDADTELGEDYLQTALPFFADPEVGAIATHGVSRLKDYTLWQKYFITYRVRLWRIIQWGIRFGQTWKYTNVSFIVPGSLSLYRSSVLKHIEIDAPGLIIEDFNMTFELHKKKLGKIAYTPEFVGIHQDPFSLHDYVKQVFRWNVGFFQTVKRNGVWPSIFWFTTTVYYIELYLFALFIVLLPFIIEILLLNQVIAFRLFIFSYRLVLLDVILGVFVADYMLTVIAAFFERKPSLLIYGLGFFFLRYIDSLIYLAAPFVAFFSTSSGLWKSPKRL